MKTRDLLLVPDLFCQQTDLSLYHKLHAELEESGLTSHQIWSSWHGDSHLIADDRADWKKHCPTFHWVLDRLVQLSTVHSTLALAGLRTTSQWRSAPRGSTGTGTAPSGNPSITTPRP